MKQNREYRNSSTHVRLPDFWQRFGEEHKKKIKRN